MSTKSASPLFVLEYRSCRGDLVPATFFNRARICIGLIERYGLKKMLMAAMEAQRRGAAESDNARAEAFIPKFNRFTVVR